MITFRSFVENYDDDEAAEVAIKHKIASKGQKRHLDKLIDDKSNQVRIAIAERGFKDHLDKLVKDPFPNVRAQVALKGHKEHLDKLVNDPDVMVRRLVTRHGHKEHLDKLVNDHDTFVRRLVLQHGHKDHLQTLLTDPVDDIATIALNGLGEDHIHEFLKKTAHKHPEADVSYRIGKIAHYLDLASNKFTNPLSTKIERAIVDNENTFDNTNVYIGTRTKDPYVMNKLSTHANPNVRATIANNPELHNEKTQYKQNIINRLSNDPEPFVRRSVDFHSI